MNENYHRRDHFDSEDDEFPPNLLQELELPDWVARSDPEFRKIVTNMLHSDLENASRTRHSSADLWQVFEAFLRRYMYTEFLDEVSITTHSRLVQAVTSEDPAKLRAEAVELIKLKLYPKIREEVSGSLRASLTNELQGTIRTEIEQQLREEVRAKLLAEMRPLIATELKRDLLNDSKLIAEVKAELNQRILRAINGT